MAETLAGSTQWWRSRRWLLVATSMLLLWIIGQIDKTNIALIIADAAFLKDLGLVGHNAELGGLMTTFFIGYGLSVFLWGFLVDRFGPKICAVLGAACWGVVLFLSSRAQSLEALLVMRFLLGVAEGNLWPVCNALTNRWFPVREHSRVQAFWITSSTLGTAVGVPVVTAALVMGNGWRGALMLLSLLTFLPVLLFLFLIRDRPRHDPRLDPGELAVIESDVKVTMVVEKMTFRELLQSTPFWLVAGCQLVSATTIYTLIHWIPTYIKSGLHMSHAQMTEWVTIGYLVATVVTLVVGYVGDRTMQRAATGGWVCFLFAVGILPAASMFPPIVTTVLLSTFVAAPAAIAGLNGALMHTMVRPEAIARGTGVYIGIGNFLSSLGPLLFGALITATGGQYWGGFLFLALLNAFGFVCYLGLHRMSVRTSPSLGVAPAEAQ